MVVSRQCPRLIKMEELYKMAWPWLYCAIVGNGNTCVLLWAPRQQTRPVDYLDFCHTDASLSTFDLKTLPLVLLSNCSPPGRKEGILKRDTWVVPQALRQ